MLLSIRSSYNSTIWSTDSPFGQESTAKFMTLEYSCEKPLKSEQTNATQISLADICQDVVSQTAASTYQCCCHVVSHILAFHLCSTFSPSPILYWDYWCWDSSQLSLSPGAGTEEAKGSTTASFGSTANRTAAKQETAFQDGVLC